MNSSKSLEIIIAANNIIETEGIAAFTLEKVAQHAKISKGGLLYHFPSKEALIVGMIKQLILQYNHDINYHLEKDEHKNKPGALIRAYAKATFEPRSTLFQLSHSLIAVVSTNIKLLDPLKEQFDNWQTMLLDDGLSEQVAFMLRLAVDGLWFAELLDLAPPTDEQKIELKHLLIDLSMSSVE